MFRLGKCILLGTRTPHLWKFMRMLLEDSSCNPAYIRWENKSEGVFRIVPGQSKQIAVLWGLKKNNPSMTFDKLSRSLRYLKSKLRPVIFHIGSFRNITKICQSTHFKPIYKLRNIGNPFAGCTTSRNIIIIIRLCFVKETAQNT